MHADNARSGQLTGSLLLHGVLYNTQRSAHDGQRLRAQGKQHLGYAAAQHRRKKIGKWVRDLLGIVPGSKIDFERESDGRIVLVKLGKKVPSRFAKVRGSAGKGPSTDEIMALTRGD